MAKLSVNVNKVATLRNTRDLGLPSVVRAAATSLDAGAAGITVHPRPDARHVRPGDVTDLADLLKRYPAAEYNIEGNPFEGHYMAHVERARPTQCTLVPDEPSAVTSNQGWRLTPATADRLRPVVHQLKQWGCRVSLFIDAAPAEAARAAAVGADRVELYTEPYAAAFARGDAAAADPFAATAAAAVAVGLGGQRRPRPEPAEPAAAGPRHPGLGRGVDRPRPDRRRFGVRLGRDRPPLPCRRRRLIPPAFHRVLGLGHWSFPLTIDPMFSGALTALVTPFRDGRFDESRFKDQVEFQIRGGIDGLVPVGTTGESPTLSFDEHVRVIELAVKFAAGRVPVVAGVGANATAEAVELHHAAKDVGATAGLSVNPYYNKPSQEGLYRHFTTLADRVPLPIVLYNIPGRTGITMTPATVARLAEHPNVVAIKEATGSLDMASEIMSLCDLTVLSGDDSLTLPLMSVGAKGVISVASNLLPTKVTALTQLARTGNYAAAREVHRELFPLIKTLFLDGNPAGIKHAMSLKGLDSGEMRLPLWEANDATRAAIEKTLSAMTPS